MNLPIENTYLIADLNIRIRSNWDKVHRMCRDYLVYGEPDFCVFVEPCDIEAEREEAIRSAAKENNSHMQNWSDAYLETLAVYRKIAERQYASLIVQKRTASPRFPAGKRLRCCCGSATDLPSRRAYRRH